MINFKKIPIKILDYYFSNAFQLDIILAVCLIILTHFSVGCIPSDESLNDSTSTIIDNSVSLAGFILAALTIVVSFRASVMSKLNEAGTTEERKRVEERMNGLELLLTNKNFYILTAVFTGALKELLSTFAILGTIHLFREVIPDNVRFYLLQVGYLFTILAISRSLFILFRILAVEEVQTREDQE